MYLKIHLATRTYRAHLVSKPMATGGEGAIYPLTLPEYGDCALKLYRTRDKAREKRAKIMYMIANPPTSPHPNIRFCWPVAAATEESSGEFCGFIMLRAFPTSRDLTILEFYSPRKTIAELFPDDEDRGWHNRFELNTNVGIRNRLKMLYNWVAAIEAVHNTGRFVLVDIKPENILVTSDGKISLIDMDSCQVAEKGALLFPCNALTPGYFPPDAKNCRHANRPIDSSCDSFAIGCCIYAILTGTHPYNNTRLLPPYNTGEYTTLGARVDAGLYHSGDKSRYVERIPSFDLHANADRLSPNLNMLFRYAFSGTKRPTMAQWRTVLKDEINRF